MEAIQPAGRLSVGDVVAERYRVEAVLGEGGMGVVYRADHLHLRKHFAIKVLLPELSSSPEIVARFEREAVAAGNIQSPHVAAATDFGRLPGGTFFLVMEYVKGRTLRTLIDAGALEPTRALVVAMGVASGLQAAHAVGVVHRDLKPENVMLVERHGDPDFVKLLDFGIAKVEPTLHGPAEANPLTRVGSVIGTPEYMSPEQALGERVDARTDQYALGLILFEMLTGTRPFEGDAVSVLRQRVLSPAPELPAALATSVDPRVRALLRRLLATAPENRIASAAAIVAEIDAICRDARVPLSAPPPADSMAAVATPIAQRVRRSVVAGVDAVRSEARLVLANPRSLLRERRVLAGSVAAFACVGVVTLLVGFLGRAPERGAAAATGGATEAAVTTAEAKPSAAERESVADLPPLASPSSSSSSSPSSGTAPARPSPARGTSHRTGPGGVYIPPPSQWFR